MTVPGAWRQKEQDEAGGFTCRVLTIASSALNPQEH